MRQRLFNPLWKRLAPNPAKDPVATATTGALTALRAASQVYQAAHWQASGPAYYGDHLLYQRLYEETSELTDAMAERVVGLFGSPYVDAGPQASAQTATVTQLAGNGTTGVKEAMAAAQNARAQLLAAYQALQASTRRVSSIGLDDLLMSTSSRVDEHLYLLQQRLGGQDGNTGTLNQG